VPRCAERGLHRDRRSERKFAVQCGHRRCYGSAMSRMWAASVVRTLWWMCWVLTVQACGGVAASETHGSPNAGAPNAGAGAPNAGAGAPGHPIAQCNSASTEPDPNTLLMRCEDGTSHRPESVSCQTRTALADAHVGTPASDQLIHSCQTDADCSELLRGYCNKYPYNSVGTCSSPCLDDSECPINAVCACSSLGPLSGTCTPAGCRIDADCPSDSRCTASNLCRDSVSSIPWQVFACSSPNDECSTSEDCGSSIDPWICAGGREGPRVCQMCLPN